MERVLPRIGVEVPAEQEVVGLAGARSGGEFGSAAQERCGGQQPGAGRGGDGAFGAGAEAGVEHLAEGGGQQGGQAFVGAGARLQPEGRAVVDEQEGAACVHQGGGRSLGMADELLPEAFAWVASFPGPECYDPRIEVRNSPTQPSSSRPTSGLPPTFAVFGRGTSTWCVPDLMTLPG
ncbi:hypothetical protein STENM327S_03923 [Streptomyces tendae]